MTATSILFFDADVAMPPKRKRSSLTDIYPNYMGLSLDQSGADVFSATTLQLPIARIPDANDPVIMELLWADTSLNTGNFNAFQESTTWGITTGIQPTVQVNWQHGNCLLYQRQDFSTALTSGGGLETYPIRYSWQSKDGHGLLVATDALNFWIDSTATGIVNNITMRIYYRFVSVSIEEYVGIVQSQQQ